MPLISVFTPTYNRATKLHRVFNSLVKQTLKDFEWIIVDDGSSDETKSVVEKFIQQQAGFPITYFFQPNAGKHIAINKGLELASGDWFHIADSDDELEPQTLEVFLQTWNNIPVDKRKNFCGIVACCKDQHGNRISDKVPGNETHFDGHIRPLYYKYKFRHEFFHIYRTEIFRQFLFPDIRNQFIPESIIWRSMSDKYKVRVIADELRIYYMNEEGDSLMSRKGKSLAKKAFSNCIETSNVLNCDLKYFFYYPAYFCKMAVVYHCYKPLLQKEYIANMSLKLSARVFAWPFMFAGLAYKIILQRNYNKQVQQA